MGSATRCRNPCVPRSFDKRRSHRRARLCTDCAPASRLDETGWKAASGTGATRARAARERRYFPAPSVPRPAGHPARTERAELVSLRADGLSAFARVGARAIEDSSLEMTCAPPKSTVAGRSSSVCPRARRFVPSATSSSGSSPTCPSGATYQRGASQGSADLARKNERSIMQQIGHHSVNVVRRYIRDGRDLRRQFRRRHQALSARYRKGVS
jgi:hypothetical protein